MARARRAKPRRLRLLILLILVALLAGGAAVVLPLWSDSLNAITSRPATSPPQSGGDTTPHMGVSPSRSATLEPTAKPGNSGIATPASLEALRAVESCRKRVQAADEVLKQARTGITNWEIHVDAQRQWESGKISIKERQARFNDTRLKGPADQKRYADALSAYP